MNIFGTYVQLKNVILVSSTRVAQLGQSSPGQGRSSFRLSKIWTVLVIVNNMCFSFNMLFYHSGNPKIWTKKLFFTLCIFRLGCITLAPLVKLLKVFTLKKSGAIVRQAEISTTGSTTLLMLCQIVSVSVNHTKIERNRFSLA